MKQFCFQNATISLYLLLVGIILITLHVPAISDVSGSTANCVAGLSVRGWKLNTAVKSYTPQNMYEQINGRAEYFIAYDVVGMTYANFIQEGHKGPFINLFIYDMGNSVNAFGAFSGEKSQGGSIVRLGREAYVENANFYIWKGQYYICVVTSGTNKLYESAGRSIADQAVNVLQDAGDPVWGLSAMPKKDLIQGSVKFAKRDAMGLDFMHDTYMAQYRKGKAALTMFLSKCESENKAKQVLVQYEGFAKQYGKTVEHTTLKGTVYLICDMWDAFDVVFQKDGLIAGVTSAENKVAALDAAQNMYEQLR